MTDDQLRQFEEKEAELHDALLEAYAAGYAKALRVHDIDAPVNTVPDLKKTRGISEGHYYYWDGRTVPLIEWIGEQFDVPPEDANAW